MILTENQKNQLILADFYHIFSSTHHQKTWHKQKHNVVLLLEKLPVQEKEMQENDLKELLRGEGVQVVLGEELQEELAGEELQEELAGEELQEEDARPPPIFYSNFAKSL